MARAAGALFYSDEGRKMTSSVKFNEWPIFKNNADRLTSRYTDSETANAIIDDMTYTELIGTAQVLVSYISGIDVSIAKLGELRVDAHVILSKLDIAIERIEKKIDEG